MIPHEKFVSTFCMHCRMLFAILYSKLYLMTLVCIRSKAPCLLILLRRDYSSFVQAPSQTHHYPYSFYPLCCVLTANLINANFLQNRVLPFSTFKTSQVLSPPLPSPTPTHPSIQENYNLNCRPVCSKPPCPQEWLASCCNSPNSIPTTPPSFPKTLKGWAGGCCSIIHVFCFENFYHEKYGGRGGGG